MGALLRIAVALACCAVPAWLGAESLVRVRTGDRITEVALERYVEGAVASEVYADWPPEALKAQAVVARTYALHQRGQRREARYDLESTVISQRYGTSTPGATVRRAVGATRGEYLAFAEAPALAVFHASAGGRTASSLEVWGRRLPYLVSVPSPDDAAPDHFWSYEIAVDDLVRALLGAGLMVDPAGGIGPIRRSGSGRVTSVEIGGNTLSGRDLREILGGRAIRSTLFDLRAHGGSVLFLGSGAGHGVGLSQWGARELALQGRAHREILAHYYPGTRLRRIGPGPDPEAETTQ